MCHVLVMSVAGGSRRAHAQYLADAHVSGKRTAKARVLRKKKRRQQEKGEDGVADDDNASEGLSISQGSGPVGTLSEVMSEFVGLVMVNR